jgi:1-acyl-sn-glycerol-3-phosphate acyltransferase
MLTAPTVSLCPQKPRPVHGLVLADHWKNPLVAWGLNACGSIPLQQSGGNLASIKKALDSLSVPARSF